MSDTNIADVPQNTSEGQAGGSTLPEGGAQASQAGAEPSQAAPAEDAGAELVRLKAELAEKSKLEAEIADLRGLRDFINGDRELQELALAKLNGQKKPQDEDAEILAQLNESFDEKISKALLPILKNISDRSVAKAVGQVEPRLRGFDQVVRGSQFERALASNGLTGETVASDSFNEVLKEHRARPAFRQLQEADPAYAAEILASSYRAKVGGRDLRAAEAQRLAIARGASSKGGTPARAGAASAGEAHSVRKGDIQGLYALLSKGVPKDRIKLT